MLTSLPVTFPPTEYNRHYEIMARVSCLSDELNTLVYFLSETSASGLFSALFNIDSQLDIR